MEIEDSGGAVEVILGADKEPRLKRERNYTLRVTVVTQYANICSTTHFSKRGSLSSHCFVIVLLHYLGTHALRNSPGIFSSCLKDF